jgi:DNA modification methylase
LDELKVSPWHLDMPEEYRNQIVTGDCRDLAQRIPDESVDLIFTDPPYPKEYIELYGWLAETGARVLKPGGSLITLLGHAYLPEVLDLMRPHLNYHWTLCQYQPTVTNTATFWPRMVFIRWKPLLWFVKGKYSNRFMIQDGVSPAKRDKTFHHWGQPEDSAMYWLYEMTGRIPNCVVLEPFAGGGTVPAVCKALRKDFVAFEIDPEMAQRARNRLDSSPLPLLIVEPEQTEMSIFTEEPNDRRN